MVARISLVSLFIGFIACSSSSSTSAPTNTASDGGSSGDASNVPSADDGGASSADSAATGPDSSSASGTLSASCDGDCAKTDITVTFSSQSKPLTRAQFGLVTSDGGATLIHLEAHDGGSAACPTESSPTTLRTLVVEDIPVPADGSVITSAQGVTAAFFDFEGSLLANSPYAKASTLSLKPSALILDDNGKLPSKLAVDIEMTFPDGGTLMGHAYAEHCTSMDQ